MKLASMIFAGVFAMAVAVGPAHAACTKASIKGTFGYQQVAAASGGAEGAGIGQITFDGKGNVSGTNVVFVSYASSVWKSNSGSFSGTYTVAKNCTGTVTTVGSSGNTSHFSFAADDGKKGAQFIETDSTGAVQLGFLIAEGTGTCGLGTASRTFAPNLFGIDVSTGPVGYVGQLVLASNGDVTGSLTLSLDGTVTEANVTGTYTEGSNCIGTAAITPAGSSTLNFDFVVVDSGKELLLVESDSDTVVSGNAQM